MPPPSDIVKVAVEWPGANAQLLEIDQVRPGNQVGGGNAPQPWYWNVGSIEMGSIPFWLRGTWLLRILSFCSRKGLLHPSSRRSVMGE